MAKWNLAKSLETLRKQVNAKYPDRSKSSDGTIGDTAHSARKSDHNPNAAGVVCALDLTHDPASGFDSYAFAEMLRQKQDDRIKYLISNRRICSGTGQKEPAWKWRPYGGTNAHDHHNHISVKAASADDACLWDLGDLPKSSAEAPAIPPPTLRKGAKGDHVEWLQKLLNKSGAKLDIDGRFGPGTETAVKKFQARQKFTADGSVGPQTWAALTQA